MPPTISPEQITSIELDNPLYLAKRPDPYNGCRLDYHHYSVPLCVSPKAWQPMTESIKFYTPSNGASVEIPGNYAGDDHYSTTELSIFEREIRNNAPDLLELYVSRRHKIYSSDSSLPRPVYKTLKRRGETLGAALTKIQKHWEHIHGFGPKRVHELLYTDIGNTGTPDNHDDVAMVACPNCNEAFWQFIPNDYKLNYLHTLDVYCPCCHHNVTQPGCIGHERIPVRSFIEPDPEPPFPTMAPYEANPQFTH